jgi:Arc/MetJ family transcription regulator
MGRTHIEIDERLIARVMCRYGLKTKRAAVDLAMRRLDVEPMRRGAGDAWLGLGWRVLHHDADFDAIARRSSLALITP